LRAGTKQNPATKQSEKWVLTENLGHGTWHSKENRQRRKSIPNWELAQVWKPKQHKKKISAHEPEESLPGKKMKQGRNWSAPRKMKNFGRLTPKNSATTPNRVQGAHLLRKKIMTGRGNGTPCAGSGENMTGSSENPSTKRRYKADRDWAARGEKWKLNMEAGTRAWLIPT
jgi:hypothetical protein